LISKHAGSKGSSRRAARIWLYRGYEPGGYFGTVIPILAGTYVGAAPSGSVF
jgi:hypothetical protein